MTIDCYKGKGDYMYEFLVFLQIMGILALISALVYIFRDGSTYTQRLMLSFTIAELVHNAGFLLELLAQTQREAMLAIKVEYMGGAVVAIFFMMFIFNYCGYKGYKVFERTLLLSACLVIFLVWTSDWHNLYYKNVEFLDTGLFPHVHLTYNFGFYFYIVICTIIPWAVSVITLFRQIRKEKSKKRVRKFWIIIGGAVFTFSSLVLYLLGVFPQGYDPAPISMAGMFTFLVFLVWNRKDFDLSRTATQTVLNSLGDCMVTLDENYNVLMYNDVAKQMFTDLEEGRPIQYVDKFPAYILETEEAQSIKRDGKHYEGRVRAIVDYEQLVRGYTVLITDVTDTYMYIDELNQMRRKAEAANRSKSNFLANMSHEIRTPMNAIIGMSDILISESRGQKNYEYAVDVKTAALNLLSIINDILDFSKIESGKMEVIEGEYKVLEQVRSVSNIAKVVSEQKKLEFYMDISNTLPSKMYGDAGKIRQILINLVNNAIKFTNEGYVRLEISGEYEDDESMLVKFVVKDTGIGIKEEDKEIIFEAFRQIDMGENRHNEGTGLGLTITNQLIRMMNGNIRVESEYGKGSSFIVYLRQRIVDKTPISETWEEINELPEAEEVSHPFVTENYNILLVDDNAINRKVANTMLKFYGFKIAEADSGKAAIARIKYVKYDLILMDHMMPEMDGVEATRIIREECGENGKNAIIIALTANAIQGAKEMYLQNGFDDFLSKPFDRRQLQDLLEKWVPKK